MSSGFFNIFFKIDFFIGFELFVFRIVYKRDNLGNTGKKTNIFLQ